MLCAVYKSRKKSDTYLFIERREDFSSVPEPLLTAFGRPQLVMMVKLDEQKPLAFSDVAKVKQALKAQGFYLQMPPAPTNLLDEHKAFLKSQSEQS
ncbi:MAG: YcgL domain-containing protein [Aeromonas sp.]|jgi:uncharacterized protein YcgL (UPF0745 family)